LAGFFGSLALLLAGLGLYGVTAYAVARRRAEIGIRMALGAEPAAVIRLVLTRVAWQVASGVGLGVIACAWSTQFVTGLLYGLEPRDPVTLIGAAAMLAVVGLIAGWIPAYRASRMDAGAILKES
jgi:ABC-type antimicrobial peptide transport system permease subunit